MLTVEILVRTTFSEPIKIAVFKFCGNPENMKKNNSTSNDNRFMSYNSKNVFMDDKYHDDVIKWKYFPRYWPFVWGIHRSPVNYPHKGQWRGALMFTLICARRNGWVYNREAGDLRRYRLHYDVIVMTKELFVNGCEWISLAKGSKSNTAAIFGQKSFMRPNQLILVPIIALNLNNFNLNIWI